MKDKLKQIEFSQTLDGSTGLYNNEVKDIYHSVTGAYSEAFDKFVNPIILSGIKFDNEVKILDICYGIGYNSKCAANILKNDIYIDALETDNNLVLISPFINDNIDDINLKLSFISEIYKTEHDIKSFIELYEYFKVREFNKFFSSLYSSFYSFLLNTDLTFIPPFDNCLNLHNIYYNYISTSMNNAPKEQYNKKLIFNPHICDARKTIRSSNNSYDIVFLDAFSCKKNPTLWTIDFLNLVKQKMKSNSLLLSYSKSTAFRSALIELGFYVGKTFINNSDMGTIASFNKQLINNPLNEYDFKLINSRSGITYKDPLLTLSPSQILYNRNIEINNSNRISRTKLSKML